MKTDTDPYKSYDHSIERELNKVRAENVRFGRSEESSEDALRRKRLEIDIADLLTGPTCGAEAERLAHNVMQGNPEKVALALIEAGERYLQSLKK